MTKPIDLLTGGKHSENIKNSICNFCGKAVGKLRNEVSKREHGISGFCQKCQDDVFGKD